MTRREESELISFCIVVACVLAGVGLLAAAVIRHLWTGGG